MSASKTTRCACASMYGDLQQACQDMGRERGGGHSTCINAYVYMCIYASYMTYMIGIPPGGGVRAQIVILVGL